MRDIKYIRRVGAGVYFYIATVTVKSRPKARVTLVVNIRATVVLASTVILVSKNITWL